MSNFYGRRHKRYASDASFSQWDGLLYEKAHILTFKQIQGFISYTDYGLTKTECAERTA